MRLGVSSDPKQLGDKGNMWPALKKPELVSAPDA